MTSPTINSITVPSVPNVPKISKKMPKPFARPSINLGGDSMVKRDWRIIPAVEVRPGDILPGVGRVSDVQEQYAEATWTVTITGGLDNVRVYGGHETVQAFTAAR